MWIWGNCMILKKEMTIDIVNKLSPLRMERTIFGPSNCRPSSCWRAIEWQLFHCSSRFFWWISKKSLLIKQQKQTKVCLTKREICNNWFQFFTFKVFNLFSVAQYHLLANVSSLPLILSCVTTIVYNMDANSTEASKAIEQPKGKKAASKSSVKKSKSNDDRPLRRSQRIKQKEPNETEQVKK